MDHVAALAECREVAISVVRRVVIAVRSGKNDSRGAHPSEHVVGADLQARAPTPTVAPGQGICVPPAAVAEVEHVPSMRPVAALTASTGPAEADGQR